MAGRPQGSPPQAGSAAPGRRFRRSRNALRAPLPLPASPPCRSFIFLAKNLPGTHGTGRREFSFAGS